MTRAMLWSLLVLLKTYRAALTWSTRRHPEGFDTYREHADAVIRDVRFALAAGGFYRYPTLAVRRGAPRALPVPRVLADWLPETRDDLSDSQFLAAVSRWPTLDPPESSDA